MRLTARDAVNAGLCVSGQKQFCVDNNIDFKDFLMHGIPVSDLMHIDDDNLRLAIEKAHTRRDETGRG